MEITDWDIWQWVALFQHELLLFAGVFFLVGAIDDIAIDLAWLWLKLTGRADTPTVEREALRKRALSSRAAVFIPAWQESAVIGDTIAHALNSWPQENLRIYIGCYRNDPQTIDAAMAAAAEASDRGDTRLRIVVHDCAGPSTKADCLNRLHRAMRDDERRARNVFGTIVFHDAEDLVDPGALALLDAAIADGADFVQLPVEPLPQPNSRWLGSHYCEEFAEAHGKAMVVRGAVGAALPAAGVGCAISRRALRALAKRHVDGAPFEAASLTEDYEMGLTVTGLGGQSRFIRARGEDGRLIATRAWFPSRLDSVVRQKTRWVHGIALQGWDRVGWGKGPIEVWMRARDRRGPLTALVLLAGYALCLVTLLQWAAVAAGMARPSPLTPLLTSLLYINLGFFIWRAVSRFAFSVRNYGWVEGVRAVLRIPVTNVIAIMAGRRAVMAYLRTLAGRKIEWDKTPHDAHPARDQSVHNTTLTSGGLRPRSADAQGGQA